MEIHMKVSKRGTAVTMQHTHTHQDTIKMFRGNMNMKYEATTNVHGGKSDEGARERESAS